MRGLLQLCSAGWLSFRKRSSTWVEYLDRPVPLARWVPGLQPDQWRQPARLRPPDRSVLLVPARRSGLVLRQALWDLGHRVRSR